MVFSYEYILHLRFIFTNMTVAASNQLPVLREQLVVRSWPRRILALQVQRDYMEDVQLLGVDPCSPVKEVSHIMLGKMQSSAELY